MQHWVTWDEHRNVGRVHDSHSRRRDCGSEDEAQALYRELCGVARVWYVARWSQETSAHHAIRWQSVVK